jgi:hypothetical protein
LTIVLDLTLEAVYQARVRETPPQREQNVKLEFWSRLVYNRATSWILPGRLAKKCQRVGLLSFWDLLD